MTTWLDLYTNPPSGTIPDGLTTTTATSSLTHSLSADLIPNFVIDRPQIGENLVGWAKAYLANIQHPPTAAIVSRAASAVTDFNGSVVGGEATIVSLYSLAIKGWSHLFVMGADQVQAQAVSFIPPQVNGICADWEWLRLDEPRMVVELKGRKVFDKYCDQIRGLATANNGTGSTLATDSTGHVTGARAILIKLGRQMITDNCQLGMLFGGHRFILFVIYDAQVNGEIHHRMLCSRIYQTAPTDGSPGAIQVTTAALLGPKHAYFNNQDIPTGIRTGLQKQDRATRSRKKRKPAREVSQAMTQTSCLKVTYSSSPEREYIFGRTDTNGEGGISRPPCNDGVTANLVLYDPIGAGALGSTFDADLKVDDVHWAVAAKFFDPDTAKEEQCPGAKEMRYFMLSNEIETYKRLSDSPFCLQCYGAFLGIGFTGKETGLIVLEQLSSTKFGKFSDMTPHQRQTAYNYVLELHKRGIHHGDISEHNFGLKAPVLSSEITASESRNIQFRKVESEETGGNNEGSLVIYDFSHSTFFDECDPEACGELKVARQEILDA